MLRNRNKQLHIWNWRAGELFFFTTIQPITFSQEHEYEHIAVVLQLRLHIPRSW